MSKPEEYVQYGASILKGWLDPYALYRALPPGDLYEAQRLHSALAVALKQASNLPKNQRPPKPWRRRAVAVRRVLEDKWDIGI